MRYCRFGLVSDDLLWYGYGFSTDRWVTITITGETIFSFLREKKKNKFFQTGFLYWQRDAFRTRPKGDGRRVIV